MTEFDDLSEEEQKAERILLKNIEHENTYRAQLAERKYNELRQNPQIFPGVDQRALDVIARVVKAKALTD